MNGKPAMLSSGILAHDLALARHAARLAAIEAAIDAIGKLRSEYGLKLDDYPATLLDARRALKLAESVEIMHGNILRGNV